MKRSVLIAALTLSVIPTAPTSARALGPGAKRFVQQISADPFGGVDGSEADTETEPDVAVDPNDPSTVVAVFQQGRFMSGGGSIGPGYATSHDGGRSWTSGNLPGLTLATGGSFDRASDPAVAIGPNGAVYAQTLPFDADGSRSAVAVQRSDDGGLTFGSPVLVEEAGVSPFLDKNWIAVDTFPGSAYQGRVYSIWSSFGLLPSQKAQFVLRYSDDSGTTWSGLVTITTPAFEYDAQPLVQPNGDVTIVYNFDANPPCRQMSRTSHDGGVSFDPPATIAACEGGVVPGIRSGGRWGHAGIDPISGALYVVWQDSRFRTDGRSDIAMSVSTDGGASWTAASVVNHASRARARATFFTPAVAAYDGVVVVSYLSNKEGTNAVFLHYAMSTDRGATFAVERRLTRRGNLAFAAVAVGNDCVTSGNGCAFLGDYMGLAASPSAFHAVWCRPSRPTGGAAPHQTTWSATVLR